MTGSSSADFMITCSGEKRCRSSSSPLQPSNLPLIQLTPSLLHDHRLGETPTSESSLPITDEWPNCYKRRRIDHSNGVDTSTRWPRTDASDGPLLPPATNDLNQHIVITNNTPTIDLLLTQNGSTSMEIDVDPANRMIDDTCTPIPTRTAAIAGFDPIDINTSPDSSSDQPPQATSPNCMSVQPTLTICQSQPPRSLHHSRERQRQIDLLTPLLIRPYLQLTIDLNGDVSGEIIVPKPYGFRPWKQLFLLGRPPILTMETDPHENDEDESMANENAKKVEDDDGYAMDENQDNDEIHNNLEKDDDTVMQTDDVSFDSKSPTLSASSDSTTRREIRAPDQVRILTLTQRPKKKPSTATQVKPFNEAERRIYHILVEMNQVYHNRIQDETDQTLPTSLVFDEKCLIEPDLTSELLGMIVQFERAKYFISPRFPPVTTSRLLTPATRRAYSRLQRPSFISKLFKDDGRETRIPKSLYEERIQQSIELAQSSLTYATPHQPSTRTQPFRSKHPFQPTLLTIREDCAGYRLVGGWTGRSVYWDVGDPMYMDLEGKTHQASQMIVMCR